MINNKKKRNNATITFTDKRQKEEVLNLLHDRRLQDLMPEDVKGKDFKMVIWVVRHLREIVEHGDVASLFMKQEEGSKKSVITKNQAEIMNNEKKLEVPALQEELQKVLLEKAETELDIRRGELTVKKINAMANLEKAKLEFEKLQLEKKRLELEERRIVLEEYSEMFGISKDIANMRPKLQHIVGKTMLGLFPAWDAQVAQIMTCVKKLSDLEKEDD